jgi:hypothetical protein
MVLTACGMYAVLICSHHFAPSWSLKNVAKRLLCHTSSKSSGSLVVPEVITAVLSILSDQASESMVTGLPNWRLLLRLSK